MMTDQQKSEIESLRKEGLSYRQIAEKVGEIIMRYKSRPYPAVIPIPSGEGASGFGMDGIRKDVEKAIGADILFNREDK